MRLVDKLLSIFLLIAFLFNTSNAEERNWGLVYKAQSFTDSQGYYPPAEYYIDLNTLKKSEHIMTFDMKQVLERPLSDKTKIVISKSSKIDCNLNRFGIEEVIAYDAENNYLGKEATAPKFHPIPVQSSLAVVRDYVCAISGNNKGESKEDELLKELENVINRKLNRALTQKEHDELLSILQLTKDIYFQYDAMSENMEQELAKYDFESFLDPNTLKEKNKISLALKDLNNIKDIMNKYEGKYNKVANPEAIQERLIALNLSEKLAKNYWKGYQESFYNTYRLMTESFSIERKVISEIVSLLKFMKSNFGDFYFIGEQIYFNSDQNVQIYNDHLQNIQKFANQEIEIEKKVTEMISNYLNKLKNY